MVDEVQKPAEEAGKITTGELLPVREWNDRVGVINATLAVFNAAGTEVGCSLKRRQRLLDRLELQIAAADGLGPFPALEEAGAAA